MADARKQREKTVYPFPLLLKDFQVTPVYLWQDQTTFPFCLNLLTRPDTYIPTPRSLPHELTDTELFINCLVVLEGFVHIGSIKSTLVLKSVWLYLIKWASFSNITFQANPWVYNQCFQLCPGKIRTDSYWFYANNYIVIKIWQWHCHEIKNIR